MSPIDNEIYKSIGRKIRLLRKYKGFRTEQLAQATNLAEGTIKNIESGAPASFLVYYNIAKILEVPLDSFVSDYNANDYSKEINSADMQIFMETYKTTPLSNRALFMNVIKAFHEKYDLN